MDAGSDWELEKQIGQGSFGVVRLFHNKVTQKKVVVKECRSFVPTQDDLERWEQELDILKRLDHPNIVHALDLPGNLRLPYNSPAPLICLEYCEMGDLRGVLKNAENCCGLPEESVRQICSDINSGIRFLHSRHIVHRDLKPENVLIKRMDAEQVVYKLTDFGYAKVCDQGSMCTSMVGTVQYVAPEVIKGTTYNSAVDFWSFGMVVFECITGKRPFVQGNNSIIGWIEVVARKKPDDIWLPTPTDGIGVDTSKLPQPNQLCSHFSDLITSWLKTALQYDPEMRKSRRAGPSDVPCSELMERILSAKVVNCVCMTTGAVCSIEVQEGMRVSSLQEALDSRLLVPTNEQCLVCSDGRHLVPTELVTSYLQSGLAVTTLYLFTCSSEPSFKLIHHRTPAINTLIQHQDSGIPRESRRDIYAHVFFQLREQMAFFSRLCSGHATILILLEGKCAQLKALEASLTYISQRTIAVADFVKEMHSEDCVHLEDLRQEQKVPELKAVTGRTILAWRTRGAELDQMTEELEMRLKAIAQQQEISKGILAKVATLRSYHDDVCDQIKKFKNFVDRAKDIFFTAKYQKNGGEGDSSMGMCDLFLSATVAAQQLVEKQLNGKNYCVTWKDALSRYCTVETQLQELQSTQQALKKLNLNRRDNIWKLLSHERKATPFTSSPISSPVSSTEIVDVASSLPARFISQISQASSDRDARSSISKQSSDYELSQSSVDQSYLCGILENDPADSDNEIEKNKALLKRLHSLLDVHSLRSSKASLNESA